MFWAAAGNGKLYNAQDAALTQWEEQAAPADANRVSVDLKGNPVIVGEDGFVYRHDSENHDHWAKVEGIEAANDIAVGMEGSFVVSLANGNLTKAKIDNGKMTWVTIYDAEKENAGHATSIAVGKGGRIMGMNEEGTVYWPRDMCNYTPPTKRATYPWTFWVPKDQEATWHDARDICMKAGGDLASVSNGEELHFVKEDLE